MTGCVALSNTNFFATPKKQREQSFNPNSQGGDAFGTKLTRNCRFCSSGLNLTSEGLLLGASLQLCVRGTSSDPASQVLEFITLLHTRKGDS
jgi:hypothetical protein